jgi:hypothetical protein
MEKLSFELGIKEYCLNDDENAVIRINTRDYGLIPRIEKLKKDSKKLMKDYQKKVSELSDNEIFAVIGELDQQVRQLINTTFDSDICSVAFGNANCLSFAGGRPIFMNFLDVLLPRILSDIQEEQKASEKYIKSYTDQAKNFK